MEQPLITAVSDGADDSAAISHVSTALAAHRFVSMPPIGHARSTSWPAWTRARSSRLPQACRSRPHPDPFTFITGDTLVLRLARFALPIGTALLVGCATADDASSQPILTSHSPSAQLAWCGRLMGDAAQSLPADTPESAAYAGRVGRLAAATQDADTRDIDAGVNAANGWLRTADVPEVTAERRRCSAVADWLHR
jgi:hypothetical protein